MYLSLISFPFALKSEFLLLQRSIAYATIRYNFASEFLAPNFSWISSAH